MGRILGARRHAWGPAAAPPPELRELLAGRRRIEVRRCSMCGAEAAWAEAHDSARLLPLARRGPRGWERDRRMGACGGAPGSV